jgi:hypothetical protein
MVKIETLRYLIIFFAFQTASAHQYTLTIAAIFKDEAPYLKEWIEYHKMMGVEQFRLYNNDSEDDYLSVLEPYIQNGEVVLIQWPSTKKGRSPWTFSTQHPAYLDAINHYNEKSHWLALIDIDEFLLPLEHADMISFLKDYEEYPGVVLNWQCFGTSFIEDIPPGQLIIESLTLKAEEYSRRNIAVKSIVKPDCVDINKRAWIAHTFSYLRCGSAVYADKQERPENLDQSTWKICTEKAVINHYVHRSERYFWQVKIPKKLSMEKDCVMTDEYIKSWRDDCNQVEDKRIFRFVPTLKEKITGV